jgi:hypothetical protein
MERGRQKLVYFHVRVENEMFVEIYRNVWTQDLGELERLIDQNLEQILEQRFLLATLEDGRKADLLERFLQDLLSTRQIYFQERERLLAESRR